MSSYEGLRILCPLRFQSFELGQKTLTLLGQQSSDAAHRCSRYGPEDANYLSR